MAATEYPASMTATTALPTPRIAYIHTTSMPDWNEQDLRQTLRRFVKQEDPSVAPRPRHHFLIGACNETDERVRGIIVSYLPPGNEVYFHHVRRTDLEVRISRSRAATPDGKRFLQRCADDGVPSVVRGETDEECHGSMLEDCDYIIDERTTYDADWFLNNARVGVPQDSMLANPEYDVNQHDASKHRLWQRYQGRGWRASSGAFHGNYDWSCRGCGGKCKRGRCKTVSYEPPVYANYYLLPEKGSREWADLTAHGVMNLYMLQSAHSKHVVQKELRKSIDTFSGD